MMHHLFITSMEVRKTTTLKRSLTNLSNQWYIKCRLVCVAGGDGHQPATEPGNPDIVYAQWQQGKPLSNRQNHDGVHIY